jgi:hypothetical protein
VVGCTTFVSLLAQIALVVLLLIPFGRSIFQIVPLLGGLVVPIVAMVSFWAYRNAYRAIACAPDPIASTPSHQLPHPNHPASSPSPFGPKISCEIVRRSRTMQAELTPVA